MKTTISKATIQATIATALVTVSVAWAILLSGTNHSLKNVLNTTKLEKEKLLSEKIATEKELKNTAMLLEAQKGKNEEADKSITALLKDIETKEAALKTISFDNKKALEKEYAKLKQIKSEMEAYLTDFNQKTAAFESTIQILTNENDQLSKTIYALKEENLDIRNNLALLQGMAADNYLVEAGKGRKDKLTIKARKTDNIQINFAIPGYLDDAVSCTITTPDGRVLHSRQDSGFSFINTTEDALQASLYVSGTQVIATQTIKMIYTPDFKLKPGIYEIDIYSNKVHMGNCKLRLQ